VLTSADRILLLMLVLWSGSGSDPRVRLTILRRGRLASYSRYCIFMPHHNMW